MQDLDKQIGNLLSEYNHVASQLQLEEGSARLEILRQKSQAPDFWQDNQTAQATMKQIAGLEARVMSWQAVKNDLGELRELAGLKDENLQGEIEAQYQAIKSRFDELKQELSYNGPYDDHDAIITISAGAGGTDAQDWAQMLLRMYTRWGEKQQFSVALIDESPGEEAGLKRAVFDLNGTFAYGKLKGEHGVHRLVRLSPFNSDNLRQTSFAKVDVLPKISQPEELEIDKKELKIDVFRAGGHGGQSVNTTDSAVRITHIPTGINVSIQNERSQLQNKETALTVLRSRLAQLQLEQHKEKLTDLKGPNQSAEWGNQIRSYVLHPYKQVKDLRTKYESNDPEKVLDGEIDGFIAAYIEANLSH